MRDDEESKSSHDTLDVKVLSLKDVTPQNFNDAERLAPVEGIQTEEVVNFIQGNAKGYVLLANNLVYEIPFELNNGKFKAQVYLPLKNKKITNLYCGINSFFAYETKTIPPIDTWTNADIVKWAKDNKDLNDYANILRFENVSGKALLRADKAYLVDKLGVTL